MNKGTLYIISAPSGAGKSTLLNAYLAQNNEIDSFFSISHTTRNPREGEMDAVHYHFVTTDIFKEMIEQEDFIEYAQVFDNYYGTSKRIIENHLNQGHNVFLDIDWQGARQVRQKWTEELVSIYILPPSVAILEERLKKRGLDDEATITKRMARAVNEMKHYKEYDYAIVNDQFDVALRDFNAILLTQSLKTSKRMDVFE